MTNPTNPIDKLAKVISPKWALSREKNRLRLESLGNRVKGASKSREATIGWRPKPGDASAINPEIPFLRDRSRDLNLNNPVARAASTDKVNSVVGTGLRLVPSVDYGYLGITEEQAFDFESSMLRIFNAWADSEFSDIELTSTFPEHLEIAFWSTLEAGDHFILLTQQPDSPLPISLALQHIEADRISNPNRLRDTPNMVEGVSLNPSGGVIGYNVSDKHPGSGKGMQSAQWTYYPAFSDNGLRNIIHLYRKLRAGQYRAYPDLSPIIEPIKQLDRYFDLEVEGAVKNAIYTLLITSETGEGLAGIQSLSDWAKQRKDYYGESGLEIEEGSSRDLYLFPDDKVEGFNPSRPNDSFEPFVNSFVDILSTGLELPSEVILKKFNSSFSAARAALITAWKYYHNRRDWLARRMCSVIYELIVYESVAKGLVSASGFFENYLVRKAYSGSEWIGDSPGNIDEQKAVAAANARVEGGLSTRKRESIALTGDNWENTKRQIDREKEMFQTTDTFGDEELPDLDDDRENS